MNGSWVILLDDRVCTIQAEFKGDDLKIFIDGRALEFKTMGQIDSFRKGVIAGLRGLNNPWNLVIPGKLLLFPNFIADLHTFQYGGHSFNLKLVVRTPISMGLKLLMDDHEVAANGTSEFEEPLHFEGDFNVVDSEEVMARRYFKWVNWPERLRR